MQTRHIGWNSTFFPYSMLINHIYKTINAVLKDRNDFTAEMTVQLTKVDNM